MSLFCELAFFSSSSFFFFICIEIRFSVSNGLLHHDDSLELYVKLLLHSFEQLLLLFAYSCLIRESWIITLLST